MVNHGSGLGRLVVGCYAFHYALSLNETLVLGSVRLNDDSPLWHR